MLRFGQSTNEPKATDIRCPKKNKCEGTLHNVASRLEEALGNVRLRCDTCGRAWAVKVRKSA